MRFTSILPRIMATTVLTFLLVLAASSMAQTVSNLHSFNYNDGDYPQYGVLTQGRDGRMYGTAQGGGTFGDGTIFKQSTVGSGTVVVYNFNGSDGKFPLGGLTLARDGCLYGTTYEGGAYDSGVVFKINPAGVFTVLYSFTGGADGLLPTAPPIEATDGNFYGTTSANTATVYPTVYRLTHSGVLTTIYTFPDTDDFPAAQLLQTRDGYLYATAEVGGASNCGKIVKLTLSGVLKATHSFNCGMGGDTPVGAPIQGTDGGLYGTTLYGGAFGKGIIYKLDGKSGVLTTLYSFGGIGNDGRYSQAGLVQASDGNFYGATGLGGISDAGSLYQFTAAGAYTQLYSFPALQGTPGAEPYAAPAQHTSGTFYGTTLFGGTGFGSVYSLDMGIGPFITFVRAQGHSGAVAQILGQGLTGTTSITFNGVPATSFSVASDTYMTAVVPSGATTGLVVVSTPTGTLTSNKNFRIPRTPKYAAQTLHPQHTARRHHRNSRGVSRS